MADKIIICFDGTCNHPNDAKQEKEWFGLGEVEDNGITNILKLHILFGGDLKNESPLNGQRSFYYSGVGTYGNTFEQTFNMVFALENMDVGRIIKKAGKDLKAAYTGDEEIFIFGFSRGAAIARRFASVIDEHIDVEDGAAPVRFLGVFDTVASIGLPNLDSDDKPISDVVFENGVVSPFVQEALHLVSIDENRVAFQPTLMSKDERVTEIWFPGAHADVGGGFWFDGLSDGALEFMLGELKRRKLELLTLDPDDVDYAKLRAPDGSYEIDFEDLEIKPLHYGKSHPKDRWFPFALATLDKRDIRVDGEDLSDDDLPIVHDAAWRRFKDVRDYRPRAMKGVKHRVMNEEGKIVKNKATKEPETFRGLRDYK